MHASLALRQGVLWIAHGPRVARIVPFDVNGRRLGPGFEIGALRGGTTDIRGIAVDEDRRLWAADAGSASLRVFTVAGAEIGEIRGRDLPDSDRPGAYGDAAGIAAQGLESEARLLLSRRGDRRHALQLIDPERGTERSLVPDGGPTAQFEGLGGVALSGRLAWACETRRSSVQVFRDGEFHYRISMPFAGPEAKAYVPRSVAGLADGRAVVACHGTSGGGVFLFDAGGRCLSRLDAGEAGVENPTSVVVQAGATDRESLALVLDRDGERVQAFTLQGWCLGSFQDAQMIEAAPPVATKRARPAPE